MPSLFRSSAIALVVTVRIGPEGAAAAPLAAGAADPDAAGAVGAIAAAPLALAGGAVPGT